VEDIISPYLRFGVSIPQWENNKPSCLFEEYMYKGHMTFIGRLRARQHYKIKSSVDLDFLQFVNSEKIDFNETYRMGTPNIDSEYYGTAKYDRAEPQLCEEQEADLNLAFENSVKHFRVCSNSRICELEIAMQQASRGTSAGFPWNNTYKNKGEAMDAVGVDVFNSRWQDMTSLDCVPILWRATVKYERRPVEKLDQFPQRLRVFTASSMEHSVLLGRMCLDMNEKFYDSAGKTTWSFVGTTPFFQGYQVLYNRLNKHPNACELDESAYDSSLFGRLLEGCFWWRWSCLQRADRTQDNFNRLYILYRDIIESHILCGEGDVVRKHRGNPSGSANTIVDNTFCLFWLFSYAFIRLSRGRKRPNGDLYGYDSFMSNVEAALNGDDNTWTCSDEVAPWFTPEAIAKEWGLVGVVTTSGTGSWEFSKLRDLHFLSCGFGQMNGTIVPMPDYDKTICSLLYGNPKSDIRFSLLRAQALRIQTFPNVEARDVLCRYINYILTKRCDELVGSYEGLTMAAIHSVYKTDVNIRWLFLGYESSDACAAFPSLPVLFEFCDILNGDLQNKRISNIKNVQSIYNMVKQSKMLPLLPQALRRGVKAAEGITKSAGKSKGFVSQIYNEARNLVDTGIADIKEGAQELFAIKQLGDPASHLNRAQHKKHGGGIPLHPNKKVVFKKLRTVDIHGNSNHDIIPTSTQKGPDVVSRRAAIGIYGPDHRLDAQGTSALHALPAYINAKSYDEERRVASQFAREQNVVNTHPTYGIGETAERREFMVPGPDVVTPGVNLRQVDQYLASKKRLIGIEENPGPRARRGGKRKGVPKRGKVSRFRANRPVKNGMSVFKAPMSAPVAMGYKFVQQNKMKSVTVRHCEQVDEISGSSSAFLMSYSLSLNPGLSTLFPWLSAVAVNYEEYKFNKLKFVFEPYVSSATAGYIAMNCDYDATDVPASEFPTKQAFTDYDGAEQSNCWEISEFNVKCPNKTGPVHRALRYGALSANSDAHNFDHGIFNLAVGSQSGTTKLGTLYVCYDVTFYRPRLTISGISNGFAHYNCSGTMSTAAAYGTVQTVVKDSIGLTFSNNVITFNSIGRFALFYSNVGTVMVSVANMGGTATNLTVVQQGTTTVNATALNTSMYAPAIVTVTTIGGFATFAPVASATTITSASIYVVEIPGDATVKPPIDKLVDKVALLEERLNRYLDEEEKDETLKEYYSVNNSSSNSTLMSSIAPLKGEWDTASRRSRTSKL